MGILTFLEQLVFCNAVFCVKKNSRNGRNDGGRVMDKRTRREEKDKERRREREGHKKLCANTPLTQNLSTYRLVLAFVTLIFLPVQVTLSNVGRNFGLRVGLDDRPLQERRR